MWSLLLHMQRWHIKFASPSDFYIFTFENKTTQKKKTVAPPKDLHMWNLLNPHVQLNPIPHFHTWTVWKPCEPWTPHVCHMKERHNFHVTHVICRRYHENTTIWVNFSRVHSHLNPVCPLVCMNQSLLKYLLSGLEVMEKTSNYLPLKIHFSKVCVCMWRWVECVITGKTKRSILVHSEADLANNPLCFVFFTHEIMRPPARIIRNQLNSISHIQLNYSKQFCGILSKCTPWRLSYWELWRRLQKMKIKKMASLFISAEQEVSSVMTPVWLKVFKCCVRVRSSSVLLLEDRYCVNS